MTETSTVLVTGGAGFIGSHLCRRLARTRRVRVLDALSRGTAESIEGLDGVEFVAGDVRDIDAVRRAADGVDQFVHLASVAGVGTVLDNPTRTMEVALLGTRNILEVARESGKCRRVVTFSTSEVYGRHAFNVRESDATEIGPVGESRWTYAVAKVATEHLAHAYYREFGLPTVSLRPFNVFGPGQVGEGAIHNFIRCVLDGTPIVVNNDGRQLRSWCFVDDMVDATAAALDADSAVGEVFNVGNPSATITVLRLAELIARLADVEPRISYRRRDYPDVEVRVPNIDKARELLGYEPKVGLEAGISRTLAWYRSGEASSVEVGGGG